MGKLISYILMISIVLSCGQESGGEINNEDSQSKTTTTKEGRVKTRTIESKSESAITEGVAEEPIVSEKESKPIEKSRKNTKEKPPVNDIVSIDPCPTQKPSKTKYNIYFTDSTVRLVYEIINFGKRDIGCSDSKETLSISIPVEHIDLTKTILLGGEDIKRSDLRYNRSGGMNSVVNDGAPTSGQIKIMPLEGKKWRANIDISFYYTDMSLNQEKKIKQVECEAVFSN